MYCFDVEYLPVIRNTPIQVSYDNVAIPEIVF